MNRKGIILAGGHGTRLYPATHSISKQLLPVYDKPMVYYPLATLMMAGIREILIITTIHESHLFKALLKDGSHWGIQISYTTQENPRGIAEAFIIAEDFIDGHPCCLILGDNILYGEGISNTLLQSSQCDKACIFGYYVNDPDRYGVIDFDETGNPIDIIEKPNNPPSNFAAIGIYFYNADVVAIAKKIKPSLRGELEITDISRYYLNQNQLNVIKLGRGVAWLDTGTPTALLEAANFIQILEKRQGLKICCPEEIAWRLNYISTQQLIELAKPLEKSGYGDYLIKLVS